MRKRDGHGTALGGVWARAGRMAVVVSVLVSGLGATRAEHNAEERVYQALRRSSGTDGSVDEPQPQEGAVRPWPPELPRLPSRGPYRPVTDERLQDPEPESWLMYRRTYDGWGYSPLREVNSSNVADLVPVWGFGTETVFTDDGEPQGPPIVNGESMFVSTAEQVIALDAATGVLLWRYVVSLPADVERFHSTNRGVALYGDKVYTGTLDARVVALEATTGRPVWERTVADYRRSYYITMAPLAANGKVLVGVSGGEFGIRGFVTALDATTGEEVWRRYTIPAPNEPGGETWSGDAWRTGGGGVWLTGTYDPALNFTYWGVGNGSPWTGDVRPGDNLFTNSTLALDLDSGEIRGHFQYHWNGSWDWDEASAPLLVEVRRGAQQVPALLHAGRNGYLWLLGREAHRIEFLEAQPYVHQDVFTSIDLLSGRPRYDPSRVPGVGKNVVFCPSVGGARNWRPEALHPMTRLLYIPAANNLCSVLHGVPVEYEPGEPYIGAEFGTFRRDGAQHVGELQAWNIDTGRRAWTREFPVRGGSVLATGGDLVFFDVGGDFMAFDARSGDLLWRYSLSPARPTGVATTYAVGGVQYVAVQFWGSRSLTGAIGTGRRNLVVAFAVDCQC